MGRPERYQWDADYHYERLGKLVAAFHELEACLRRYLFVEEELARQRRGDPARKEAAAYRELKVGEWVDEDAFTNYDQLKDLIRKYNELIEPVEPKLSVDKGVVALRHALAHGRVGYLGPLGPIELVKFSKPEDKPGEPGKKHARVTWAARLDAAWFREKSEWVQGETDKVIDACSRQSDIRT